MTIKTYVVEYGFDEEMHQTYRVRVKAQSKRAAQDVFYETYPEHKDDYVNVLGTVTDERRSDRRFSPFGDPLFRSGALRFGEFIYRRKGRKVRGRRNYPAPKRGWCPRSHNRIAFTFTEHYSAPVSNAMKRWLELALPPAVEATA